MRRRAQALAQMREAVAAMKAAHRAGDALTYAHADAAFEKSELPEAKRLVDEHVSQMAIGFRTLRRSESPT